MSLRRLFSRLHLQPNSCEATGGPQHALQRRSKYSKAASYGGEVKISAGGTEAKAQKMEKKFWMRDPSTGDWIPEDHIGRQVDVAELREKLISSSARE